MCKQVDFMFTTIGLIVCVVVLQNLKFHFVYHLVIIFLMKLFSTTYLVKNYFI